MDWVDLPKTTVALTAPLEQWPPFKAMWSSWVLGWGGGRVWEWLRLRWEVVDLAGVGGNMEGRWGGVGGVGGRNEGKWRGMSMVTEGSEVCME